MNNALRIGGAVIASAGLLLSPAFALNPHPYRWSFFLAVVCIGAVLWAWKKIEFDRLDWLVVGFVGYAALSLLWSLDWREGVMSLNVLTILAALSFY